MKRSLALLALPLVFVGCADGAENLTETSQFDDGTIVSSVVGDTVVTEQFGLDGMLIRSAVTLDVAPAVDTIDSETLRGLNHVFHESDRAYFGSSECEDEYRELEAAREAMDAACEGMDADNATPQCWRAVSAHSFELGGWLQCIQEY